ncbi:hypothetical protein DSO57_1002434 [Entomophthora muscae]|uniref:Uncharacterized protein n=1 Tax=Entomophthora muscae TaxID=34485 RepID=A0ACC2SAW2_9FUNG|nr:hypothetical protein DSO57_1002434 [Entomophthora muscae]
MSNEPEFKVPSIPEFKILQEEEDSKNSSSNNLVTQRNLLSPYSGKALQQSRPLREVNPSSLEPSVFPLPNGPQVAQSKSKVRSKVALEPGCSPLDWARLISSGKDLRGCTPLGRYTLDDLKPHNTEDDAWCAINGKVYNITAYMKFHPGGKKQLLKGAGKDATSLYNKVHPWVNADSLLGPCFLGFLEY